MKQLLEKMGEETIYSAKGHFKACDLRRKLITITIWSCTVLNIIGLISTCIKYNDSADICDIVLSALGIFGTIALLIWNEGEEKNYRAKHKSAGEKYLALHKEIRSYYFFKDYDKEQVEQLSNKVSKFDQSIKPDLPSFARKLAKKAIEKEDPETDNWFKTHRI